MAKVVNNDEKDGGEEPKKIEIFELQSNYYFISHD